MFGTVLGTGALSVGWEQFVTILLLMFGLFLILAGLFTAYFGSGKSRTIGVVLLIVGIVVGAGIGYYYHADFGFHRSIVILAAVIGALVAIGIFLVAIMKS